MTRNPFLLGFLAVWLLAWGVLIADRGRALPLAPKPVHYLVAEIIALVLVAALLRLARNRRGLGSCAFWGLATFQDTQEPAFFKGISRPSSIRELSHPSLLSS